MSKEAQDKIIVGSTEWCSFPELGIPYIVARVDSGARTSAIHALNVQVFQRGAAPWVTFEVHPLQNNRRALVRCEAPVVDRRVVKSSSGIPEKRYVIRTPIKIGDLETEIELTLTNRDSMGYRMLLGREAMTGRMLVDPSARCALGQISREQAETAYAQGARQGPGLKVAVLGTSPELYSNQRIMEAGDERGHDMVFLNIKHCYIKLDAETPEVHYRDGSVLRDLDAVIPRIPPSLTFYGCALVRHFEALGTHTLNSATAIRQSRDQLYALQLLLKKGLDIPTTGFANSPVDTEELIDMVGGAPLVVKLLEGARGRGMVLAETRKAAESVINAFKSLNANLLVQEFIKEADGKDVRCFVVDGKVVASMQREAVEAELDANGDQASGATVVKLAPEEKSLATKAAKTLGLKVAGVDMIRSKRGPLLLRVNSSPGLEAIEEASGKDVAGALIAAVERQLGWKRPLTEPLSPVTPELSVGE